ncbi:MAG TPA: hypothetical protein V6C72_16455, partial [Chroococcales cyanobacterium]
MSGNFPTRRSVLGYSKLRPPQSKIVIPQGRADMVEPVFNSLSAASASRQYQQLVIAKGGAQQSILSSIIVCRSPIIAACKLGSTLLFCSAPPLSLASL